MSKEHADKFLEEMRLNEKVKDFLKDVEMPSDEKKAFALMAEAAKAAGYEVTAAELEEAAEARKAVCIQQTEAAEEKIKALNVDELDNVAGGYWWAADDSPIDGHELFCMLAWHDIDWSKEHDDWCHKNYIFKDWYYKNNK